MKRMAWCVALALAGCQTTSPTPVPTLQIGANSTTFTEALLARRGAAGYMIISQTPNMLVLEKTELQSFGAMFVAGGAYGAPRYRLTYQIFGDNPLNVQISGALIENAGTAFEKAYPYAATKVVEEARAEVQAIAAQIATSQRSAALPR